MPYQTSIMSPFTNIHLFDSLGCERLLLGMAVFHLLRIQRLADPSPFLLSLAFSSFCLLFKSSLLCVCTPSLSVD
jgi:hypothetical protein